MRLVSLSRSQKGQEVIEAIVFVTCPESRLYCVDKLRNKTVLKRATTERESSVNDCNSECFLRLAKSADAHSIFSRENAGNKTFEEPIEVCSANANTECMRPLDASY